MFTLTQKRLTLLVGVVAAALMFGATPQAKECALSRSPEACAPLFWSWSWLSKSGSHPPYNELTTTESVIHITETVLPLEIHASGFTMYERLYVRNGTLYVVMKDKSKHPDLLHVLSKGKDIGTGENIDPTDKEMQVITPEEAKKILGTHAAVVKGMSFIIYDTKQFMAHYYHWWGEILLGAMRVYSALLFLPEYTSTPLPKPARFILPNVVDKGWRDKAGVNGPLMRVAFPSAVIERTDFWEDLIYIDQTFVFEKAMVVSRVAAHKNPLSSVWSKMISSTINVAPAPYFWEPLRQRVVQNLLGYLPIPNSAGVITTPQALPSSSSNRNKPYTRPPPLKQYVGSSHPQPQPEPDVLARMGSTKPLVIYVSRQGGGRRITDADNLELENALKDLEKEGLCEIFIARMEEWGLREQIEGVGRSTIMVGVHGDGLTHQIWMPPSNRSTVIEIFYPETYVHDYSMLARNMRHKHYGIWNDTFVTYPDGKWFKGVNGGTRENFDGILMS